MDLKSVIGQTETHLGSWDKQIKVHQEVVAPLKEMAEAALDEGFDFAVASGFRSFDAQVKIWNEKATGQRPVLDNSGQPLNVQNMQPRDVIYAILRWSALPGASRHHWGTDIDVFDRKALTPDYKVQLIPSEYEEGGIFSRFSMWLGDSINDFGFFRPYQTDKGGIAPEPWHISYAPVAERMEAKLTLPRLTESIQVSSIQFKDVVLAELPNIYSKYVRNIDIAPEGDDEF